jgi:hypothetical protein
MPDPITKTDNTSQTKGDQGNETVSIKTEAQDPVAIDVTKLSDENFAKVFEDPRLFKHTRFKNLKERAQKADEYDAQEETRKQEELKKKGEWEKLATDNDAKAKQWQTKFTEAQIDNRIQLETAKLGVVDLEAVLKLIDRSNVKVNEDGSISGVDEAVKGLLESKPYLKGKAGNVTVGSATSPGQESSDGSKRFKHSQISDPAFYKENEKEILQAITQGRVENDL